MPEHLSPTQRECLEAAAQGPFRRARNGWTLRGVRGFQTGTVEALERRGLMKINPMAACCGEARITAVGREALANG